MAKITQRTMNTAMSVEFIVFGVCDDPPPEKLTVSF